MSFLLPWGKQFTDRSPEPCSATRSSQPRYAEERNTLRMYIGTLRVMLHLHDSTSLKHKRSAIKRLLARLQRQFHVAAAEVDEHDLLRSATIGIACVSDNGAHANSVMSHTLDFIASDPNLDLYDSHLEILRQ